MPIPMTERYLRAQKDPLAAFAYQNKILTFHNVTATGCLGERYRHRSLRLAKGCGVMLAGRGALLKHLPRFKLSECAKLGSSIDVLAEAANEKNAGSRIIGALA